MVDIEKLSKEYLKQKNDKHQNRKAQSKAAVARELREALKSDDDSKLVDWLEGFGRLIRHGEDEDISPTEERNSS